MNATQIKTYALPVTTVPATPEAPSPKHIGPFDLGDTRHQVLTRIHHRLPLWMDGLRFCHGKKNPTLTIGCRFFTPTTIHTKSGAMPLAARVDGHVFIADFRAEWDISTHQSLAHEVRRMLEDPGDGNLYREAWYERLVSPGGIEHHKPTAPTHIVPSFMVRQLVLGISVSEAVRRTHWDNHRRLSALAAQLPPVATARPIGTYSHPFRSLSLLTPFVDAFAREFPPPGELPPVPTPVPGLALGDYMNLRTLVKG